MQNIFLIIDADAIARAELALLLGELRGREVVAASSVAAAKAGLEGRRVEALFIRISAWDEFRLGVSVGVAPPGGVVFLSGRGEKCTQHLGAALDFHLQAPYSAGRVGKCLVRMEQAGEARGAGQMAGGAGWVVDGVRQVADLFFVRAGRRWQPVRISDLRSVRKSGVFVELETITGSYLVRGSMAEWAGRLPSAVMRVGKGLMVTGWLEG